jgi:hypothetical protein
MDTLPLAARNVTPWISPDKYRLAQLNEPVLNERLSHAPLEFTGATSSPLEITIPDPDGNFERFSVQYSPIMEDGLAAQFPEIRTYSGRGVDDPNATVRLDLTPQGFHASVLTPGGMWYVDPYFAGDSVHHASYYRRDLRAKESWQCLVESQSASNTAFRAENAIAASSGSQLKTYRLACAATGEYTAYQGGTVALGQAAVVTAINRVTQVYEADFAIRLVLVSNNSSIIYTNSRTDPYNNTNPNLLLSKNQSNLDSVIGSSNYDIGHVVGTGGGGLAALGVVCRAGLKAEGETGSPDPTGDAFYIDYVAHEMGHQFGANHSFNGVTSNCSGANRNASTAMEPGSGTTIMAYAGICGVDDLQPHSDPYFHSISYDEIIAYTTTGLGSGCPVITATGNIAPTVTAGADYAIPIQTPFTLTASGSDLNGDSLTYCWEERDLGAAQVVTGTDNGSSPIFRSFDPTSTPSRIFPQLSDILSNTATKGEQLPSLSRSAMKFRVTVRDNRTGGGGSNSDDMNVQVVSSAGPFAVTFPNSSVSLGGTQTVTWNVANTSVAPIGTSLVNLLLSTDGGYTFPTVLAANVANDGSETVTLPNISTSAARIKVEAVGNIYWDMSNSDFTINPVAVSLSGFAIE